MNDSVCSQLLQYYEKFPQTLVCNLNNLMSLHGHMYTHSWLLPDEVAVWFGLLLWELESLNSMWSASVHLCTPAQLHISPSYRHTNLLPDPLIMGVNDGAPASERTHRYTLRETHTNIRTQTIEAYRPSLRTSSGVLWFLAQSRASI